MSVKTDFQTQYFNKQQIVYPSLENDQDENMFLSFSGFYLLDNNHHQDKVMLV
jgi:hypothetical protein